MDSDSDSSNENEILPRRSRRLSTIIPASHWMSIGYLPREAEAMETLMKDMNRYCEEGVNGDVEIRSLGFGDTLVIPYHDMMLPLWKRFTKALMISTSEGVEELGIERISMPPLSIVRSLSNAIANHRYLGEVSLQRCGLCNTSILRTFLAGCSGIQFIDIRYNEIKSDGAVVVADFISNNHPVEKQIIRLANNNLSDGDMAAFSSALKSNSHLFALDLSDNDLSEQGEKVILKAVFDTTSLNSLVDCNHTCCVWTLGDDVDENDLPDLESELIIINGNLNGNGEDVSIQTPIEKKIRMKVVLALCRVDGGLFDLLLLDDLPLQLMPRVFELIQEHTVVRKDDHKYGNKKLEKEALSRLFHILRGWHLPLLFDNLHILPTRKSKRKRGVSSR